MILGQHLNKLHEPGASWPTAISPKLIRVATLHWHQIETASGVFDWSKADAIFSKIPAGVKVILANSGTPAFYSARPNEAGNAVFPKGTLAEPLDYGKFTAYIKTILQRYPSIAYVEGINEPGVGSGYFSGNNAAVVEMQRAANLAVLQLALADRIKVISAPVVLNDIGFSVLDGLNTGAMDYIGCHFYDSTLRVSDFEGWLWRLRDFLRRRGGQNKDKPIFVTEWGWNAPPYGLVRFPDVPAAFQTAMIQEYAEVASRYCAGLVNFAYDDIDYGWQGNVVVEAMINALQAKYNN